MSTIKVGDRVHCDKWLAHRDEGWEVTSRDDFWDDSVVVHGANFPGGWTNYSVPLADCTLIPPPLQVGDRVRVKGTNISTPIVFAISGDFAFIGYEDGSSGRFQLKELERIQ